MAIFRKSVIALLSAAALGAGATAASAADMNSVVPAGTTFYVRGDLGGSWQTSGSASWTTPGGQYQAMDLGNDGSLSAGIALGAQFTPMFRADLSYTFLGHFGLDSCRLGNAGGCGNSHNTATVNTHLFMVNGYAQSPQAVSLGALSVTPFVTAGIGGALHDFSDWNHVGQFTPAPGRNFHGDTTWDFAWTVGAGASVDVSKALSRPAFLDITYRYTDAGNAQGSSQPLPGNGAGIPVDAYNADIRTHSVFVGLRIPFGG